MKMSLKEIAALCGGKVSGDPDMQIKGVNTLEAASGTDIVFIADKKHEKLLTTSRAGAVLTKSAVSENPVNAVVVENPQLAFAMVAEHLNPPISRVAAVSQHSVVDPTASIHDSCYISDAVSIGQGVILSKGVIVHSGARIEDGCEVGQDTEIHQNVVIKAGSKIGSQCRIHPGVVIGADGFGLVRDKVGWFRIPQLGIVVIGNNVDIGANTTVDRGSLGNTVLEDGVKLDNLIQVGHNVKIGRNTVVAAHTAIAGSSTIGENCEIGGCVGIMDHSFLADNVIVGGGSVISGSIKEPGIYSSSIKAEKLSIWQKNAAWIRKLSGLADRVKKLENK